jgi:hypothetical protein
MFFIHKFSEVKELRFQLVEQGERVWNRPGCALDLSKNVSESAKSDLGNSPSKCEPLPF